MVYKTVLLAALLVYSTTAETMFSLSIRPKILVPAFSTLLKKQLLLPRADASFEKNRCDFINDIREELQNKRSATYNFCKQLHKQQALEKPWCKNCSLTKDYVKIYSQTENIFLNDGFEKALSAIADATSHAPCALIKQKYLVFAALLRTMQDFWPSCYLEDVYNTPLKNYWYTLRKNVLMTHGTSLLKKKYLQ